MAQTNNECLGEIACPDCPGVAYVYQTKRRGKHLYSRCPDCGLDQKTGPKPQARLAQFVPVGTLVEHPVVVELKPSKPSKIEVCEPITTNQDTPENEPGIKPGGSGKALLFLGLPLALLGLARLAS